MFLLKLQTFRNHRPLQVAKQSMTVWLNLLPPMLTLTNSRRQCQPSSLSLIAYDLDEDDEEGD